MSASKHSGDEGVRSFIFGGGGTGGHLYPAIAIREALLELKPDAHTIFVCSDKALDHTILDDEGLPWVAIPARPFSIRPKAAIRLLWNWGRCVRAARGVIREERRAGRAPVVVAMGGYVAAPIAQAAKVEKAPLVMLNLDTPPGKANRWIARKADQVFTSARVDDRPGWSSIAPIVRRAAMASGDQNACKERLGFDPSRPLLFITGASQGARSVNAFFCAFVEAHAKAFEGWQVLHQCGQSGEDELVAAYERAKVDARVVPYCDDMASAWGAADLAVSRCGAGSVGEVWANGAPTLFLPYPYHRDQHQRLNAAPLEEAGGAMIETDHIDAEANLRSIGPALESLLADADRRQVMRDALGSLGPADGARVVAERLASM